VHAFEANALDYLLKPYSDERQEAAMARARQRLNERSVYEFGQRMLRLTSRSPQATRPLDRLVVKSGGTTRFVRVADIDCIEAAGVYVSLHVAGRKLLYRATLHELIERLDAARFVRVHRSAVVNIESILELEAKSHGEFDLVLKNGSRSRVSRTYRAHLEKRLGQSL
jgi:two-component system, LytTR family, response regulator